MMLRERLAALWWHPTIEAMQAQMLRRVWSLRPRLRLLKSMDDAQREIDRMLRIWQSGSIRNVEPYTISLVADDTYPIGETQ